jgi:chromosome segregation ATPase
MIRLELTILRNENDLKIKELTRQNTSFEKKQAKLLEEIAEYQKTSETHLLKINEQSNEILKLNYDNAHFQTIISTLEEKNSKNVTLFHSSQENKQTLEKTLENLQDQLTEKTKVIEELNIVILNNENMLDKVIHESKGFKEKIKVKHEVMKRQVSFFVVYSLLTLRSLACPGLSVF